MINKSAVHTVSSETESESKKEQCRKLASVLFRHASSDIALR